MASAILEGGRRVQFSRVRTETPLAGRMLALLGGWKVEKQEEETKPEEESRTRDEERKREKREGGHLAIKNTY